MDPDSYEAYCLDEAVIIFGMRVNARLEEAGHKPSKEERKLKMARDKVIDEIFGTQEDKAKNFADPAMLF